MKQSQAEHLNEKDNCGEDGLPVSQGPVGKKVGVVIDWSDREEMYMKKRVV